MPKLFCNYWYSLRSVLFLYTAVVLAEFLERGNYHTQISLKAWLVLLAQGELPSLSRETQSDRFGIPSCYRPLSLCICISHFPLFVCHYVYKWYLTVGNSPPPSLPVVPLSARRRFTSDMFSFLVDFISLSASFLLVQ